jgi:hypothetical protein
MSRTVRTVMITVFVVLAVYVLFTVVFLWVHRQLFANPVLG